MWMNVGFMHLDELLIQVCVKPLVLVYLYWLPSLFSRIVGGNIEARTNHVV